MGGPRDEGAASSMPNRLLRDIDREVAFSDAYYSSVWQSIYELSNHVDRCLTTHLQVELSTSPEESIGSYRERVGGLFGRIKVDKSETVCGDTRGHDSASQSDVNDVPDIPRLTPCICPNPQTLAS